jgi:hypothetical protein
MSKHQQEKLGRKQEESQLENTTRDFHCEAVCPEHSPDRRAVCDERLPHSVIHHCPFGNNGRGHSFN